MKSFARVVAVAVVALAPFAAYSQDQQVLQSCVDSFVAQNFAGQATTVRIERSYSAPMPLAFRATPRVALVATDKATARVLATATCSAKNGVITVEPVKTALIAAL